MKPDIDDWTDEDILDYLRALDGSEKEVTEWDAKFVESNLEREIPFTARQREHVARLVARYGEDPA